MPRLPVHVVGAGNIGCLVAAALSPQCDVQLVLRSSARLLDYKQHESTIRIRTTTAPSSKNTTVLERRLKGITKPQSNIENLILATKAYQARSAIEPLIPYMTSNTNIVLLQNGLGLHEQLQKYISEYTEPQSISPKFHFGIVSHGVHNSTNIPWEYKHVGQGNIKLASLDDMPCALVKELQAAPLLNAQLVPIDEFRLVQMEKLVANACINPLTAILGCKNGLVFESCSKPFLQSLVVECCNILQAHYAKLINNDYSKSILANIALNPTRMYKLVEDIATLTAENKSSMLSDIERNQQTELEYINKYLIKLAKQYGLSYTRNQVLSELVEATARTTKAKLQHKYMPLETGPLEEYN